MRVLLTAGHDRASHVRMLADDLTSDGVSITGIIVVSPFQISRLRQMIRSRGLSSLYGLGRKLLGRASQGQDLETDVLQQDLKKRGIQSLSLKKWARDHSVAYRTVKSLNADNALAFAKVQDADGIIYGGGGILREPFLKSTPGGVLNAHSGPLPQIRGMNAAEWSLLLGYPLAVTVHFIDVGIDTGRPVATREIDVATGDSIDQIRSKCVLAGMALLRENVGALKAATGRDTNSPDAPAFSNDPASHRQCYLISPLLRAYLAEQLAQKT